MASAIITIFSFGTLIATSIPNSRLEFEIPFDLVYSSGCMKLGDSSKALGIFTAYLVTILKALRT